LYLSFSRPFDRTETGKIAAEVIDRNGDEESKVYETRSLID